MSRSFPINCTVNQQRPNRIAKVGLDDHRMPVLFLWCKRCRTEHKCSLGQLMQSWVEMMQGDKQALTFQQGLLKKALMDVQAALDDLEQKDTQQQEAG